MLSKYGKFKLCSTSISRSNLSSVLEPNHKKSKDPNIGKKQSSPNKSKWKTNPTTGQHCKRQKHSIHLKPLEFKWTQFDDYNGQFCISIHFVFEKICEKKYSVSCRGG